MKLIDKDALVAEIRRRIQESLDAGGATRGVYLSERMKEDSYILSFLDTLEVKEVDLNDEKCEYLNNDGNCIYALNKTGKVMRCQYINCYRKIKAQKGE